MTAGGEKAAETDRIAARLRIYGRVQGVWYRSWAVEQATARRLDGWVRNRADGSVEARVIGPASAVKDMIAACHVGPPAAQVDHIDVWYETDLSADEVENAGFYQAPTV